MHRRPKRLLLSLCTAMCLCTAPTSGTTPHHNLDGLELSYPLNEAQKALQIQRIELYRQQLKLHQRRQQVGMELLSDSIAIEAELVHLQLQMTTDPQLQRNLLQQLQQTYQKVIAEQQSLVELGKIHPNELLASQSALLKLKMLELQL